MNEKIEKAKEKLSAEMPKNKNAWEKTVRARQLYRMLGHNQGYDYIVIQDILIAMAEAIRIIISQGYSVIIPKIGTFRPIEKQGRKVGEEYFNPYYTKLFQNENISFEELKEEFDAFDKELVLKDNKIYSKILIDEPDYYDIGLKFNKSFKEAVREESLKWRKSNNNNSSN